MAGWWRAGRALSMRRSLYKGLEEERDLGTQSNGAGDREYGCFPMLNSCTPSRIGGSIPIVFSYFSEFLAQEKRGEHLSWLCMFWMIGGVYAAAMAWAIIPHYGEQPPGSDPRLSSLPVVGTPSLWPLC